MSTDSPSQKPKMFTVEQLAACLCVINGMSIVDSIDGSPNWWVFRKTAEKMLSAVSERVAIELVTLKEEDILWRSNIIEECARLVDMCNSEGPFNAIAAASRIRALKEQTPSEIAQTNAAAQAPKPTDHGRANPVEIASKPEPQPASAAPKRHARSALKGLMPEIVCDRTDDKRERPSEWINHMDLHVTEHDLRHAGLALRAAWPAVSDYLDQLERELNAARSATGDIDLGAYINGAGIGANDAPHVVVAKLQAAISKADSWSNK